jgi:glycosyltransferase involved in cell wall biosynthesis
MSRWRAVWLLGGYVRIEVALARLGMVVTPSQAMRQFLGVLGMPLTRIRVIGHSIDVRRRAPRVRMGTPTIGVAARLEHWKGIDVLFAACAQLAQPVRVEIFGDGSQRERLEAQAAALGLDARFHGAVEDMRVRLDALDAFVLPSRVENSPLAIVEAMAHALPVVATRVGGVPELVADGQTGLLVEPDDPAALARAIARIVDQPDFAAQLGRAGALRAQREMCEDVLGPRLEQLYREALSGSIRSVDSARRPGEPRADRR